MSTRKQTLTEAQIVQGLMVLSGLSREHVNELRWLVRCASLNPTNQIKSVRPHPSQEQIYADLRTHKFARYVHVPIRNANDDTVTFCRYCVTPYGRATYRVFQKLHPYRDENFV